MNLRLLFRALLLANVLLQWLLFFLPVGDWTGDPLFRKLVSYDGYGSVVPASYQGLLSIIPLWGFMVASLGLFFLQRWGRTLYLALWIYGWITTLLFGVRIALPIQNFTGMVVGTIDGALLALIFASPLRSCFSSSKAEDEPNPEA